MPELAPSSKVAAEKVKPLDHVMRDGNELVVHRGADISQYCFSCGKPCAGGPIVCHLQVDKSGVFHKTPLQNLPLWFYALEYVLFIFVFVFDLPASRKRKVTYGFCADHRRKRLMLRIMRPLCLWSGIALMATGIFVSSPIYIGLPSVIIGLGMITASPVIKTLTPGPRLSGQNKEFLWLKGAGKEVLEAQPKNPAAAPSK